MMVSDFGVLEDMEAPDEPVKSCTYPLSLFLESWRTWRLVMNLKMLSDRREHPLETSGKFSSRFNIRNPVKTPPIL